MKSIELRDIGDHPDFNFDPFYISNQIGIQTLDLRELRNEEYFKTILVIFISFEFILVELMVQSVEK